MRASAKSVKIDKSSPFLYIIVISILKFENFAFVLRCPGSHTILCLSSMFEIITTYSRSLNAPSEGGV